MRLGAGQYFGVQVCQRKTDGLCLTLCNYAPNQKLPRHEHENPGFFFLLAGDHLETDDRREKHQLESSMIYHAGAAPHANLIGPRGMIGLNISFDRKWLASNDLDDLRHRSGWSLEKPRAKGGALHLLAGLTNGPGVELESISVELLEMMNACTGSLDSAPPKWLRNVRQRIDVEYMNPLSLNQLAVDAAVHPVYLARAFRKANGLSVTDYLHQVRILHAVARVAAGMTVGDAAAQCGFCDQAYLARLTKSKLGVKPTEFNWFQSSKSKTEFAG